MLVVGASRATAHEATGDAASQWLTSEAVEEVVTALWHHLRIATPAVSPPAPSPAGAYLASLGSQTSRRSMERSLRAFVEVTAELAEQAGFEVVGAAGDPAFFRWERLDYGSAVAIKAAMAERWAPATVNRHLAAVRGVTRSAFLLGLMPQTRVEAVREALRSVRSEALPAGRLVTEGELRALFASLAERDTPGRRRDAAMLAILAGAGLRRAELVGLDVEDWHPDERELVVRHGKDGRVDPRLGRLSTNSVYLRLRSLARRASVPPLSPHDCRRTVASSLLDRGADLVVVAALLGHAHVGTTSRYDRRPESAKQRASELIHLPYVAYVP